MIFNLEPLGGPWQDAPELPPFAMQCKVVSATHILAEAKRLELKGEFDRADELRWALFDVTVGTHHKP